ncbi:MAG TPA: nitrilase-related carbon-nitrogen hydrolase [Candidatus Limnocylindrales bacterium]|nr:nitrilase-related carbon-nitrogen hydrolase [Candidatus Limnocylindrales bacterium]
MNGIRVAIAQCAPALGAFGRNLEMHLRLVEEARAAGARLVVFPELSLTGYYLKDLASDLACAADDERLRPLAEASRRIDVLAGFVERTPDGRIHIASGYWADGALRHVHRKVYLPTYGIFDDGRYFAAGDAFGTFESAVGIAGMAICEDLWHVSTPYLYAIEGALVIFAPSASPGRGVAEGGDLGTAASCRLLNAFCAQYLTVYVVFANRVGHEDGIAFWGGSEVVAPDGTVLARAAEFAEELLVAELDPALAARERARNPLLRDEREDLVLRTLARRAGLQLAEGHAPARGALRVAP